MKSDFKVKIPSGSERIREAASCSLRELPPGTDAVVVSIDAAGAVGRRLLDLGLLPGTSVRVLRRAPLGDPSSPATASASLKIGLMLFSTLQ